MTIQPINESNNRVTIPRSKSQGLAVHPAGQSSTNSSFRAWSDGFGQLYLSRFSRYFFEKGVRNFSHQEQHSFYTSSLSSLTCNYICMLHLKCANLRTLAWFIGRHRVQVSIYDHIQFADLLSHVLLWVFCRGVANFGSNDLCIL